MSCKTSNLQHDSCSSTTCLRLEDTDLSWLNCFSGDCCDLCNVFGLMLGCAKFLSEHARSVDKTKKKLKTFNENMQFNNNTMMRARVSHAFLLKLIKPVSRKCLRLSWLDNCKLNSEGTNLENEIL